MKHWPGRSAEIAGDNVYLKIEFKYIYLGIKQRENKQEKSSNTLEKL